MEFGVAAYMIGLAFDFRSFFMRRNANAARCAPHFGISIEQFGFCFHGYLPDFHIPLPPVGTHARETC